MLQPFIGTLPVFAKSGGPYLGPKGGLWADPQHTVHWEGHHGAVDVEPHASTRMYPIHLHIEDVGNGEVKISPAKGASGPTIPRESLNHLVNDLRGVVDVPKGHAHPGIAAVARGDAKMLGKGDDGVAFKHGDVVVKVSTTVPYQPFNQGHRTPKEAADMLKAQVDVGNHLADLGLPVVRSEFIRHGDKGFQIKPYVEIPPKLSREQLDEVQAALHAMHDKGYAMNDDIQAGELNGKMMFFDVGKAAPAKGEGQQSDKSRDIDRLRMLYQQNGQRFVNSRDPVGKRMWNDAENAIRGLRQGKGSVESVKRNVERAADARRKDAHASLSGKELAAELEDIDMDVEWANEDIDGIKGTSKGSLAKGSHVPPAAVRSAARRGLELRKKHGKGGLTTQEAGKQGIGSGVARASNLAAGDAVSTETLRRMVAFFSRHRKNKSGGEDDAGYIAWLLWGGDPGEAWAKRELAKVDRVEKGATLLQPILDLVEVQQSGWLELPRSYALSLGAALAKGLSHRYIKRVPTGKFTKTGKPRYRYYYHAAHGGTVGHEDHFVVGASFKDNDGHWHITGRDGDTLTLKHDETGAESTMTARELREHLVGLHREAIAGAQERARQDIADAKASGATAKQIERLHKRAERIGIEREVSHGDGEDGRSGVRRTDTGRTRGDRRDDGGTRKQTEHEAKEAAVSEFLGETESTASPYLADVAGRREWKPVPSPAITLHEDLAPTPTVKLPDHLKVFPNPEEKRGITQLFSHQIDGAERALTAFEAGDGIVISDDAGLGKTNTGMATLLGYGGKRNIIVVPTAGKRGISKQWEDTAKLYGVPVVRGMPTHEGQEGIFVVSYDELPTMEVGKKGQKVAKPKLHPSLAGDWDLVVFDESHNLANDESVRTQAAMQLQDKTGKAVYLSATPFTTIADMHYLTKLGMWKERKGFTQWAKMAGADVRGSTIRNPKSPLPMAAIAATLHVDGKMLKRVAQLKGLESRFGLMDSNSAVHPAQNADAARTFAGAQEVFDTAVSANVLGESMVKAFKSSWARQYWETLKVPEAVKLAQDAIAQGKQVALYTSFKSADHAHLRALVDIARRKADRLSDNDKFYEAQAMLATADAMERIINDLPPVKPAVRELVGAFGGPDVVAEIHGDTNKKPEEEQEAYQRGQKKVVVATMARGGTGISLHDDRGNAARVQINLSLPWSGREFNQVAGRSHRLGSKSNTTMHWLVGDDETEKKNAAIVAKRLKSMGSLTVGDPETTIESRQLANWEFGTTLEEGSASELAEAALAAESGAEPDTDDAQAARDYFREYAEARKSGRDVITEEYQRRRKERMSRAHSAARRALLQLETRFPGFANAIRYEPRTEDEIGAYGVPLSLRTKLSDAGIKTPGKVGQRWYINPEDLPQLAADAAVHRTVVEQSKLQALRDRHEGNKAQATDDMGPVEPVSPLAKLGDFTTDFIRKFSGTDEDLARLATRKLGDRYGLTPGQQKFWSTIKDVYIAHVKAGGESLIKPKAPTEPVNLPPATPDPSVATGRGRGLQVYIPDSHSRERFAMVSGNTKEHKDFIRAHGGKWRGTGAHRGGFWSMTIPQARAFDAILRAEEREGTAKGTLGPFVAALRRQHA